MDVQYPLPVFNESFGYFLVYLFCNVFVENIIIYNMLKIVATRASRMPVSPAAWSSSSRMSLGGGGAGGGGEVVLAVDGGE